MINKLEHYKNTSYIELRELLKEDISFSVLYSILEYDCTDIFTNHKSVIICYSNHPFPVWVYCKDVNNKNDVSLIGNCLIEHYFNKGNFNIDLSKQLLEKLKDFNPIFFKLRIKLNLLSYKMDELLDVSHKCDGYMELANEKDLDLLSKVFKDMVYEMEGFVFTIEECKDKVLNHIKSQTLFVWRNAENKIVALTSKGTIEEYSKISSVYTLPTERRKGYAMNLVHGVSRIIIEEGLTPILYTDGSNPASNECYKKIGFKYIDRLVNIDKGE